MGYVIMQVLFVAVFFSLPLALAVGLIALAVGRALGRGGKAFASNANPADTWQHAA